MTADYTDDELLDLAEAPVAPTPAPAPAPTPHPPGHWVITIPHPRMPSARTVFEAVLIALVLVLLAGRLSIPSLPLPIPGPHHVTGPLEARLIHDVEKDGFATARLKSDATLAPALRNLDCRWGWLEADDPTAASLLKGTPTPAVSIAERGKTEPLRVLAAPRTGAEVVAAVKALRGVK